MKTKQRTLLGLLVLVLLLGGALALLTRQNQKAEQAASEAAQGTIPLSSFAADDLTEIVVTYNGETLISKKRPRLAPGEMENVIIKSDMLKNFDENGIIEIQVEE